MTETLVLAYVFATFAVGAICTGGALVLARLRRDALAKAFLLFYVPLSVLVLSALLLAFMETQAGPSRGAIAALEYMEAFIGRYGVMLGLPLFVHRLFSVRSDRRDVALLAIVLIALLAQHVTEFVLGGSWDARGDVAEDVLFAALMSYATGVGFRRMREPSVYRPLARAFLAVLVLGLPAIGHDLLVVDGPGGLRLYPLWYCMVGAVTVLTLVGRHRTFHASIPVAWGLSPREEEVVRLVQKGLSNRDIARELTISPNTVKTHLQAIFRKSGFRTRIAVISALAAPGTRAGHPAQDPPA